MVLGVGCFSLWGSSNFLGILCRVWVWEGKFSERNDSASSLILCLAEHRRQYSGREQRKRANTMRCGVLTKRRQLRIRVGAHYPRIKTGDEQYANCMWLLHDECWTEPHCPWRAGSWAYGQHLTQDSHWGTSITNTPHFWTWKYLCGVLTDLLHHVFIQWQSLPNSISD